VSKTTVTTSDGVGTVGIYVTILIIQKEMY